MSRLNIFKRRIKVFKTNKLSSIFRRKKEKKVRNRKVWVVLKVFFSELFKSKIFRIISSAVVIACLVIFGRYFLFSSKFEITKLEISGCENLEKTYIEDRLNYLYGKNIFFIRASSLGNEVENFSAYIKSVKVEKHLPGEIYVTIEEREPYFVLINLEGAYLVDREGFILEVVSKFEPLALSSEDIDLLKGYGNLKETSDESSDEEEETEESEESEDLTLEEKYAIIETDRQEVVSRVEQYWEQNTIPEEYQKFPFVYSYFQEEKNISDVLDQQMISSIQLGLELDFLGEEVMRYIWESEFHFVFYLERRRKIVFSSKRDFEEQVEDLRVLLENLKKEGFNFSYIDLSSDIIVYELEE